MAQQVVSGAMMMCTFGAAPGALTVLPANKTNCGGTPAATIMEQIPMVNIPAFGVCSSPSNPTVAAATAAALGVLTPMPCVPNPAGPWAPGSPTVQIAKKTSLNSTSTCNCAWGGVISITTPGQTSTSVP